MRRHKERKPCLLVQIAVLGAMLRPDPRWKRKAWLHKRRCLPHIAHNIGADNAMLFREISLVAFQTVPGTSLQCTACTRPPATVRSQRPTTMRHITADDLPNGTFGNSEKRARCQTKRPSENKLEASLTSPFVCRSGRCALVDLKWYIESSCSCGWVIKQIGTCNERRNLEMLTKQRLEGRYKEQIGAPSNTNMVLGVNALKGITQYYQQRVQAQKAPFRLRTIPGITQ